MRTIFTAGASVNVTNTATETTLVSTVFKGSMYLPKSFFTIGRGFRLTARGTYGTEVVPVTLNIRVKLGSVTIITTGDQTPAGTMTDQWWELATDVICRSTGTTGTVIGHGSWRHGIGTTTGQEWAMVGTAATINTRNSLQINLTADWGVGSDTDDDCVCDTLVVEAI